MEDETYKSLSIPEFGITFQYPYWWQHKIEDGGTYLFWDEYTGSFRITPFTAESKVFNQEQYLQNRFNEYAEKGLNPIWKTYNNQIYLYYEDDSKIENTRYHWYITTALNLVVVCSFAYGKVLLDDEYSKDELEGALEELDKVLASLTIGK